MTLSMNMLCNSIRSKSLPLERCTNRAKPGIDWCGKHATTCVRYTSAPTPTPVLLVESKNAMRTIQKAIVRWIARRAGPLAWFREQSNNPTDFYTYESVAQIRVSQLVSFVDGRHGYCMEVDSVRVLLEHSTLSSSIPVNPYTNVPLSPLCIARLNMHIVQRRSVKARPQTFTDLCSIMNELEYYTDPAWFAYSSNTQIRRIYLELYAIWLRFPGISNAERARVKPLFLTSHDIQTQKESVVRTSLLSVCERLLTGTNRGDKQQGALFIVGAMTKVLLVVQTAYPDIAEMFMHRRGTW